MILQRNCYEKKDHEDYDSSEAKADEIEGWSENENDEYDQQGYPKKWNWQDPKNLENWESDGYKNQKDSSSSNRSTTWKRARAASSWNIRNVNPVHYDAKKRRKN